MKNASLKRYFDSFYSNLAMAQKEKLQPRSIVGSYPITLYDMFRGPLNLIYEYKILLCIQLEASYGLGVKQRLI